MQKSKVVRLRPGDSISFGDHKYLAQCTGYWHGDVIYVTPAGGVKVRVTDERPWLGPVEHIRQRGNEVRWVPYTHVISIRRRRKTAPRRKKRTEGGGGFFADE